MKMLVLGLALLAPLSAMANGARHSFYDEKNPFKYSPQAKQAFEDRLAHPHLGGAEIGTGTGNRFRFQVVQHDLHTVSPDAGHEATIGSNGVMPRYDASFRVSVSYHDSINYFGGARKLSLRAQAATGRQAAMGGSVSAASSFDVELMHDGKGSYTGEFTAKGYDPTVTPLVMPRYLSFAFGAHAPGTSTLKWDSNYGRNYPVWSNEFTDQAHRWIVGK